MENSKFDASTLKGQSVKLTSAIYEEIVFL